MVLVRFPDYTQLDTHTQTQTHSVGLLWTSNQPVTEIATYTTHNKHKIRTSTLSVGFEQATPEIKRLQA